MEDYRKLAMEAAMKIPYQTHSELLVSADKIYAWLMQNRVPVKKLYPDDPKSPYYDKSLLKFHYVGIEKENIYAYPWNIQGMSESLLNYFPNKKSPSDADEDLTLP